MTVALGWIVASNVPKLADESKTCCLLRACWIQALSNRNLTLILGLLRIRIGLPQLIQQMPALHFAAFGFVRVAPKRRSTLRVFQSNPRMPFRHLILDKRVQSVGPGKLAVRNGMHMRPA